MSKKLTLEQALELIPGDKLKINLDHLSNPFFTNCVNDLVGKGVSLGKIYKVTRVVSRSDNISVFVDKGDSEHSFPYSWYGKPNMWERFLNYVKY